MGPTDGNSLADGSCCLIIPDHPTEAGLSHSFAKKLICSDSWSLMQQI
jgi:hypothetical protein